MKLRDLLRLQLSRKDSLKAVDVASVEQRVNHLREVAAGRLFAFGGDTPTRESRRAISEDAIALDAAIEKGAYVNNQLSLYNCCFRLKELIFEVAGEA